MNKLGRVKKFITVFSAAAIFATSAFLCKVTASADTYNYRIDQFTGEEYYDENGDIKDQSKIDTSVRKSVAKGVYYDTDLRAFVYPIGSGTTEITANIMDGMIVNYPVTIEIPNEVMYTLYQNGNEVKYNGNSVRDKGEYTLIAKVEDREITVFSFTIVGNKTGLINNYTVPTGFRITSVKLDGLDANYSRNSVSLSAEGHYQISYECDATGISYSLEVTIDHTPPEITLEGVREDGKARGPVTIEGLEEGDTVSIVKDGNSYHNLSGKLTQSGRYYLQVTDNADNSSVYEFIIMIYLDNSGLVFFLVIAGTIGALVAYLILSRKKLRVR